MPWREASDLIFSARRALARPEDGWEPLACTAHRRRLSDAGCPDLAPEPSRDHVEDCDGCRGMVEASAARRAAARPAPRVAGRPSSRRPAPKAPRLRRPALVAASVRSSGNPAIGLAVGFAVAVIVALLGVILSGRLHAVDADGAVRNVAVARGA